MRPRPALLLGALLAPVLPLLADTPAQAAGTHIICVNRPADPDCPGPQPTTLPLALQSAYADGQDSVIRLGPGVYDDGPYVFDDRDLSLTIQGSNNGAGDNATLLKGGAAAPYATGNGITIRNLRVEVSGSGAEGLALSGGSIAQNIIVADDPAAIATNATGIRVDGSRVENSTVSLYRGAGGTGVRQEAGPAVVSRLTVRTADVGVSAEGGALAIDNAVLKLDATAQAGLRAGAGAVVDARHLTVVGGAAGARGVVASTNGAAAALTLANSIVRDSVVAADGAAASVVVHHTDLKPPVEEAGGTVTEGDGNLADVDPAFIDPLYAAPGGGNLALRAGSPLVDKGDPLTSTTDDRNGDGRAFDGDGNGSPVPDLGAYELRDITAPVTTFVARPPAATNDNTPVFQFRSEAGARFECRLDGGAFQPCASPTTTSALPDGPHSVTVRATDEVYNVEANPPTASFTVDTVRPDTLLTKRPHKRFFRPKVKFKFTSHEAGVAFQCKVDKQSWRPCRSPFRFTVKVGKHRLLVRAVDAAGNVDSSPARYKFKRLKRHR
ncbi:hypothetical protein [Nocardioides halotolerans]|uniref:hypothetical protein n=1 Tax=Nocardioides halotolerans TaxID=433660 RepID=UPI0004105B36|nr:hypothetical protein [Nocardioides halotolerans]